MLVKGFVNGMSLSSRRGYSHITYRRVVFLLEKLQLPRHTYWCSDSFIGTLQHFHYSLSAYFCFGPVVAPILGSQRVGTRVGAFCGLLYALRRVSSFVRYDWIMRLLLPESKPRYLVMDVES
jgi:hypothetical protein